MLGSALVIGSFLRLDHITDQILADDEWHALHAALYLDWLDVVTHFGDADYSIPLALLYKAIRQVSCLSELKMRAPMLTAGLLSLAVFPLAVRRYVGTETATCFSLLLGISPLHIYFSRYARPYAIGLFLAFVSIISFYRWWTCRRPRDAVLFVCSAVIACYFQLVLLPLVASPFLYAFADSILVQRGAGERPRTTRVLMLAAGLGLGLASLLGPALVGNWQAVGRKLTGDQVALSTVAGTLRLFFGVRRPLDMVLMGGLAVSGGYLLCRRNRRFASLLIVGGLCQLSAVVLARPEYVRTPIVLARYNLAALPFVLMACAASLSELVNHAIAEERAWLREVCKASLCVVLFLRGPILSIYQWPSNWTNHAVYQYEYDPESRWAYSKQMMREVPAFYYQLAALPPGTVRIVEAPWRYQWHMNGGLRASQEIHRQRTMIGFLGDRPGEIPPGISGFCFRNGVQVMNIAAVRKAGVRYVVFHRSFEEVDIGPAVARYRSTFGPPIYTDQRLLVFDMERKAASTGGG